MCPRYASDGEVLYIFEALYRLGESNRVHWPRAIRGEGEPAEQGEGDSVEQVEQRLALEIAQCSGDDVEMEASETPEVRMDEGRSAEHEGVVEGEGMRLELDVVGARFNDNAFDQRSMSKRYILMKALKELRAVVLGEVLDLLRAGEQGRRRSAREAEMKLMTINSPQRIEV
jgi:hypothetical protein